MKKLFVFLLFSILAYKNCVAQFDRKPFSLNAEMYVPKGLGNASFTKTFSGNLDWNASITYHKKNKHEFGFIFRRVNFKAAYSDKIVNTNIKTQFIINAFGAKYLYTYFDNAYFYSQVGFASYYCYAHYTNVTDNNKPIENPKLNFGAFEPMFNINYKASEYVDMGFQISTTILSSAFDPAIPLLNQAGKIDYTDAKPSNAKTSFISFGFSLKWYLQFESGSE